jgi:CAAX protease family protein
MSGPLESSRPPNQLPESAAADPVAAALRRFGPLGLLAIVLILAGNLLFAPLSAILVLVWVKSSRTPWREIGYVRPRSWIGTILVGLVFGAVLKVAMKAIVMPLLGAPPINQAFHFLVGNTAAIPWMLYVIFVTAGFGEETVFRGWMFERFGKLFGQRASAKIAIVLITSVWFGLDHYWLQGIPGVEQAFLVGLVFGSIFAVTGRIFMLMIAHIAFDLAALAMIYWNFETEIAHLIFP